MTRNGSTETPPEAPWDVIVVGAGPGGSAAAAALAEGGARVLVLERETFPRFHVGESLLPAAEVITSLLGIEQDPNVFLFKRGAEFLCERTDRTEAFDFAEALPGPQRYAWHVDRAKFDTLLRDHAVAAGATVRHGVNVEDVDVDPEIAADVVRVRHADGEETARYLIDATGLDRLIAKKKDASRAFETFGKAAAFTHFTDLPEAARETFSPNNDIRIIVIPDGWLWVIPLTGNRLSVGLVTRKPGLRKQHLHDYIAESPFFQRVLAGAQHGETRLIGNFSYENIASTGPRYACVGDAACFIDPVFSSGVSLAIVRGIETAERLLPALEAGTEADPELMAPDEGEDAACLRHLRESGPPLLQHALRRQHHLRRAEGWAVPRRRDQRARRGRLPRRQSLPGHAPQVEAAFDPLGRRRAPRPAGEQSDRRRTPEREPGPVTATPVPITGYAVCNAIGMDRDAVRASLRSGEAGLGPSPIPLPFETVVGAVEGPLPELPGDLAGWSTRTTRIAKQLLDDLGPQLDRLRATVPPERIAVLLGTSTAGADVTETAYKHFLAEGALPEDYDLFKQHTYGAVLHVTRALVGADGPSWVVSTACTSSAKPLATAQRLFEAGLIDAAVVGGIDTLCSMTLHGFKSLDALDAVATRPFAADRKGLNIGEGGAFLLLERDGPPIAMLEGVGESSDAYHISAPHPEGLGAKLSMERALAEAGCTPEAVEHVNAHGTGTRLNDVAESAAIEALLGRDVPVVSTKSYTGHMLGAAGGTEAAFAVMAIEHGFVPASLRADPVDEAVAVRVVQERIDGPVRRVLSNSFAFGGNNVRRRDRSAAVSQGVAVIGAGAFVPGFGGLAGWSQGKATPEGDTPDASLVPARQRRRASLLSKAFAHAYAEALQVSGVAAPEVASVFGSALGEASTMIGLLDQMWSEAAMLSPMKFATSVHNAASGLLSIATENRGFTTSLGADFDTPAMALMEGLGLVAARRTPVVVCCGDEAPPDELVPDGAGWSLLCAAIVLAPIDAAPADAPRLLDFGRKPGSVVPFEPPEEDDTARAAPEPQPEHRAPRPDHRPRPGCRGDRRPRPRRGARLFGPHRGRQRRMSGDRLPAGRDADPAPRTDDPARRTRRVGPRRCTVRLRRARRHTLRRGWSSRDAAHDRAHGPGRRRLPGVRSLPRRTWRARGHDRRVQAIRGPRRRGARRRSTPRPRDAPGRQRLGQQLRLPRRGQPRPRRPSPTPTSRSTTARRSTPAPLPRTPPRSSSRPSDRRPKGPIRRAAAE